MNTVEFTTPSCMLCHQPSTIRVDEDRLRRYREGGESIQYAFSNLSPDERELILTGTHPDCWNKLAPLEELAPPGTYDPEACEICGSKDTNVRGEVLHYDEDCFK